MFAWYSSTTHFSEGFKSGKNQKTKYVKDGGFFGNS